MKIYIGKDKEKKNLKEISLKELIYLSLLEDLKADKGIVIESDRFNDNSASWVQVDQINKQSKQQVSIIIGFDPEDDNIFENIRVGVAPVITKVDCDKYKNLI